jgi:hypothetical protein
VVSTRMVRRVPRSGSETRRERGGCGAEGQHQRVPAMGRGTGPAECRIRGDDAGAGDGEFWAAMVRSEAISFPPMLRVL